MSSAYERMKRFLAEQPPSFTAIFCATDSLAFGVARALQEAGLRIPQDISLVGFNDLPMSAFMSPPLTTIHIDCQTLGALAVQRLMERSASPSGSQFVPVRMELFSHLVERQSVSFRTDHSAQKNE